MSFFIQYHNYDREGLPLGDSHGIHTGLKHVLKAKGGQVFLIFGIGTPRQYYLWDSFTIEQVKPLEGWSKTAYHAFGPGWDLAPPQLLEGDEFNVFKKSCANFVGFRKIDDLPFARTLKRLADQHRTAKSPADVKVFVEQLQKLLGEEVERQALAEHFLQPGNVKTTKPSALSVQLIEKPKADKRVKKRLSPTEIGRAQTPVPLKKTFQSKPLMKALSIRQPHAEAILRGVKKIEYRSKETRIRGRIQIYASLGRYSAGDEAEMMDEYGIDDVVCDKLPRGVIVGTVELVGCNDGDWQLKNPERATKLLKPTKHPQPVWFNPF